MISGFFNIVQNDVTLIVQSFSKENGKESKNKIQSSKVWLAAARVFGALLMGSSLLSMFYAIPILVSPSGVWQMATYAANYAFGHDIFVMACSISNSEKNQKAFSAAVKEGADATAKDTAAKLIANDTILPIWKITQSLWLDRLCHLALPSK